LISPIKDGYLVCYSKDTHHRPRPKSSHHLRWLKEARLEDDSLSHLKRVRKLGGHTTFLICESSIPLPTFPLELEGLHDPYQLEVPMSSALTPMSLALKASLWPTLYTPRRKGELESWSKAKVRWAEKAVRRIVNEALDALDHGEVNMISFFFWVPVSSYILSSSSQSQHMSHRPLNAQIRP
jgi:hypothetical protein